VKDGPPQAATPPRPDAAAPPAALADAPAKPAPTGARTITIIDGATGKREEVTVGETEPSPNAPNAANPANPAPKPGAAIDPRLLDTTRHGAIPKISPDGTRPADVFASKATPARDGPRVAIVVGGLGIGASGTSEAFTKLPGPVTFAFAPYGTDLERWAGRARSEGHEVLLQVAMEPFDYPDNDPGPQTLLTSLAADQNIDRLHWFMSRVQGYVGIANLMGTRFTATDSALAPVLREIAKRGLIYFDDGSSPRSLANQIAGANNAAFARADVVIDTVPTAHDIDAALGRLETLARSRGTAVGAASALPLTIDRIAQWAKAAEARGIALVPVSVIASRQKSNT
jgi:polysaccharide deacetylase 2 family uncharacterized protein YibQ